MRFRNKAVIATILMAMLWNPISVNADLVHEDNNVINSKEKRDIGEASIEDKMNLDVLYVFEEAKYQEAMNKDALLVNVKNNFMYVDTNIEKLDKELDIINSAKSYFILGPIDQNVLPSKNLGGHLMYNNFDTLINKENIDYSADLIVTNEESAVDMINAIQIANVENRNLIFLKDNKLSEKDEEIIEKHGENKNILFVEGELSIPAELKDEILQLANSPKYEVDTFRITKMIEEKKVDLKSYAPKFFNTNKSDILNNLQSTSKENLEKNSKIAEETLQNKNKMLSYEETEEYIVEKAKSYRFITNLQKQDDVSFNIETNKEVQEDNDLDLSLRLTYANPVAIEKYVSKEKDVFITEKETTAEIVASVMEGDYGPEEDWQYNLEEEGYNYQEIKNEINSIIEAREREIKERDRLRRLEAENRLKSHEKRRQDSIMLSRAHERTGEIQADFIAELLKMEGWIYSQPRRFEEGYADCSSIIIRALINTGQVNNLSNMTTRTIHNDNRFFEIPMSQIEIGDILWYPGHVEVYMGGNTTFGAFRPGKLSGYARGVNRFSRAYRIVQP